LASTHYAWVNGVLISDITTDAAIAITNPLSAIQGLSVISSEPVVGAQGAFIKSFAGGGSASVHALTAFLTGTGNPNASALNVVSDNTAMSAMQLSGSELTRGTLKIAHHGPNDGSDSGAAAISIDLQTITGTGTAAQGIFVTSTTDAASAGNVFTARLNSLDQFVIKGSGLVGIGNIAIGHVPSGQLEIAQKDASTIGLFMQAFASGTDMLSFKDSASVQRLQVNNAGNLIMRAAAFANVNLQVGSVSADFGGGSSVISIKHATDPTTNPTAGGILYVDATGNLQYRTSAGNVRLVAAV
jgi:hypothetical protein